MASPHGGAGGARGGRAGGGGRRRGGACGDGGDRAGGADRRLAGVADPVAPTPVDDLVPGDRRPTEIVLVGRERGRRRPAQILRIVQAAAGGGRRPPDG